MLKNCKNYRPKCAAGEFFSDFGFDKLQKSSSQARRRRNFFGFRLRKTAKVIVPSAPQAKIFRISASKNCKSHRPRSPKTAKVIDPGPQKLQKSSTQVLKNCKSHRPRSRVDDFCSFLRFLRTSTFSLRRLAISKIWPRNQGGGVDDFCSLKGG